MKLNQVLQLCVSVICIASVASAQSEDPTDKYVARGVESVKSQVKGCVIDYVFVSPGAYQTITVERADSSGSLEQCQTAAHDSVTTKGTVEIQGRKGEIREARYKFADESRASLSSGAYRMVILKDDRAFPSNRDR